MRKQIDEFDEKLVAEKRVQPLKGVDVERRVDFFEGKVEWNVHQNPK